MTNMSKIITAITNDAQGRSYHGSQNISNCLQEPHKSPIMQKFDLRWQTPLQFDGSMQFLEDPIISSHQRSSIQE
jgi:hypothetical protein